MSDKSYKHDMLMRLWTLLAIIISMLSVFLMAGCTSEKEIAAKKARKADDARQKEMIQLQKVRVELPCDPVKIIEGKTVYLPGDSIPYPVYINGDTVIKWAKCPPSKSRVDTSIKIDRAALKAVRDSADHWAYLFGVATDSYADLSKENKDLKAQAASLKPWKTWGIVILSGLSAAGIFFGIFKLKSLFL